jgi:glycine C-acetyltransferase
VDIFEKLDISKTPLGQFADEGEGYFMFPKLEGEIGPRMKFQGREVLVWSINSYLGLANHPEVRKADAEASKEWGLAYPMGARIMTGNTSHHEKLEQDLADFVSKESAYLLNFGFQGIVSIIDTLVDRKDVIVYDVESHACIIDGVRLHMGKRFIYQHNDMENLEKQLIRAQRITNETGGGILVVTEGVFGMSGNIGNLKAITELKKKYKFRLLIDDAHGFGTMGSTGAGTGEHFGVQDEVDIYFATFAKSMASIGAFVAGDEKVIRYLKYNLRSQLFAKSLPMPLVIGAQKRLELLKTTDLREKLWTVVNALQNGFREKGYNLGSTQSPVTPVFLNGTPYEAGNLILDVREKFNIFCSMVIFPMVPRGTILLRIIPTAAHSLDDVNETLAAFDAVRDKLVSGKYRLEGIEEVL